MNDNSAILTRLQTLFDSAIALPIERRNEFLQARCGRDDKLRARLKRMIDIESSISHPLELTSLATDDVAQLSSSIEVPAPKSIGRYRILRVIASGGMGTVYEAAQDSPSRIVAVKAMRHKVVSAKALKRFDYESQVLATLSHPGIAQVHEAGVDTRFENPVPYFAMEYIQDGKPITLYSIDAQQNLNERLMLFQQVCDAVAYGHQRGIIHRDLKPSNILVDREGRPRIIDFGVARATDTDLAQTTNQTETGQLIGTLQYMSPEQCAGKVTQLDTRSDVYALGMVLFELISRELPYSVQNKSIYESVRTVHETTPRRLRSIEPTTPRDLENIVAKALEKDPQRRYHSAAELRDDIERFANGDAVLAQRSSMPYQLRVFARRNKTIFMAVCLVFFVLAIGTIVSTALYFKSERSAAKAAIERDQANLAKNHAESVAEFLLNTFKSIDPTFVGDSVSIQMLLDPAVKEIDDGAIADQPLVEATIRGSIGEAYGDLAMSQKAVEQLKIAYEIREDILGKEHPDTLAIADILVKEFRASFNRQEAYDLAKETLEIRRRLYSESHRDTIKSLRELAICLNVLNRLDEAENVLRNTLAICENELAPDDDETNEICLSLGWVMKANDNYEEAIPLMRQAHKRRLSNLGETHPKTLFAMSRLAFTLKMYATLYNSIRHAELEEAEELARRVVEIGRAKYGNLPAHWETPLYTLASILRAQKRLRESESSFLELLEQTRKIRGAKSSRETGILVELGLVQRDQGRLDDALASFQQSLALRRKIHGDDHHYIGTNLYLIGQTYRKQGNYSKAETSLLQSFENRKKVFGINNMSTRSTIAELVRLYDLQNNNEQSQHWRDLCSKSQDEKEKTVNGRNQR